MRLDAKGTTIVMVERRVDECKLAEVASAIGTVSGADTARLVPFFGPTIAGEGALVEKLGMNLSRALLGGQSYAWTRPFEPGEPIRIRVFVEDVYEKGNMQFGIVAAEFSTPGGELIQRQQTTFLERKEG